MNESHDMTEGQCSTFLYCMYITEFIRTEVVGG